MTESRQGGRSEASGTEDRLLAALMARYQAADADAAEELVRRLSPLLLRFLSVPRFTRTQNEDLLQECWLQIHRARHTYRVESPLLPWLLAIARHVRRDAWRRQNRIHSHEIGWITLDSAASLPLAREQIHHNDLVTCVSQLPAGQREVVVMLKVLGMTLKEVAASTGLTVAAVKVRAHRAYRFLRDQLGRTSAHSR